MAEKIDIHNLANLSRLALTEEEKTRYSSELEDILTYVEQVQGLTGKHVVKPEYENTMVKNVLRDDVDPHKQDEYTDDLLNEVPRKKDRFIQVKKIVDNG